jgi:hypothetical protein
MLLPLPPACLPPLLQVRLVGLESTTTSETAGACGRSLGGGVETFFYFYEHKHKQPTKQEQEQEQDKTRTKTNMNMRQSVVNNYELLLVLFSNPQ